MSKLWSGQRHLMTMPGLVWHAILAWDRARTSRDCSSSLSVDATLGILQLRDEAVDAIAEDVQVLAVAAILQAHLHAIDTVADELDHRLVRHEVLRDLALRGLHFVMDDRAGSLELRQAPATVTRRSESLDSSLDRLELTLYNILHTLQFLLGRTFDLLDLLFCAPSNVLQSILDALVIVHKLAKLVLDLLGGFVHDFLNTPLHVWDGTFDTRQAILHLLVPVLHVLHNHLLVVLADVLQVAFHDRHALRHLLDSRQGLLDERFGEDIQGVHVKFQMLHMLLPCAVFSLRGL